MVTRVMQSAPADTEGAGLGDLGALAAEADQAEGRPGPADEAAQAAAGAADGRAAARHLVQVRAALALPLAAWKWGPPVADLYGPAQQRAIAEALAGVAEKRGWSVGGVMQSFGPELALCAALAGPVLPLVLANVTKPAQADKPRASVGIDTAAQVLEAEPAQGLQPEPA